MTNVLDNLTESADKETETGELYKQMEQLQVDYPLLNYFFLLSEYLKPKLASNLSTQGKNTKFGLFFGPVNCGCQNSKADGQAQMTCVHDCS